MATSSSSSQGEQHFVDQYRTELIQQITMVHPVLDYLLKEGLLTQEHYDTVKAERITQEKMRYLYKFSRGWSFPDKETFYQALKASNPGVMENLEGTSLSAKLKKTTAHDVRLSDSGKAYRESVEKMFQRIPEYNSRMGEAVSLQKRYTKLLMRKGHQNKEEKEQELRRTDRRPLQIMEERSSDEYSPITIQGLFAPDEDGFIPNIVVLQGPAGIGKTMTSKKIMLDWASGNLYQDKFEFVFYLSCRELNTITGNISLVGLLSRSCRQQCSDDLVSILKDPGSHRKLLFLVDGFDELSWTLEADSEVCHDVFKETHKEILLQSLLRKQIVQQSSLIITTRSLAMKKLSTLIYDPRCVEIQGFTREDRKEYVHKFFGNKEDADKALRIIRDNDILYTMCAVPITCWIVCTVIQQEIKKDLALIECDTMTSIYLRYLEVLLTHHNKKDQPVDERSRATCLKKLCALANEGVLNQQILFEEKDLQRHGLSLCEVESVFLNENIFHWDVRTQTCYSFIHLSVQEFLAALYYGLDDGSGTVKQTSLPIICKERTLSNLYSHHPHLAVAVQFLFGLLNEKAVDTFSERTGIKISIKSSSAMKEWAIKDIEQMFPTHVILSLYETHNEDFIRSAMSSCPNLMLIGIRTDDLEMENNYSKQLAYCLTTLETEIFASIYFEYLIVDADCQKKLSPLLHRCKVVRFERCTFQRRYGDDEDVSSSRHEMVSDNLSFLINPESEIQDLGLVGCGLTSLCYDVLRSILSTNRSLSNLDLSFNDLPDPGINLLCHGLKHEGCTLRELSLGYCFLSHVSCADLRSILIKSLTKLDLTANYLQDSGIKLLCEGLQHPGCTLQDLSLNGCGLTTSCCDVLRSILIRNRSLIRLDLSLNDLLDSGIKLLCEGLQCPDSTLQELRLDRCGATLSCCDDICSVITKNKTLTILDITLDDDKTKSDSEHRCKVLRHAGFTVDGMNGHWSVYIHKKNRVWWLGTGLLPFW